MHNKLISFYD